MNAHVPALLRSLPEVVAEYDEKRAALTEALARLTAILPVTAIRRPS